MAVNSSQSKANHHKDVLENINVPVISAKAIIPVKLDAASRLNVGHLIINSSPEQSRSEMMTFPLREIRAEIGKETYEMMQICVMGMQLPPGIL